MAAWSYHPALDGLRSVAVYLVLLFHTGLAGLSGGFIGVDLFFVLSGFLVSGVILSEIDGTGNLRLGNFYARRVRRLLPAAVVVVVATCLLFVLVSSVVRRLPLVGDAQSALLYVANWRFLSQANDYFATGVDESPFLHFWSLSVEEQFYFVFPVLLLGLTRIGRRWRAAPFVGMLLVFTASLGAQLYWAQVDTSHAYYGTDARLYQLAAGAMVATGLRTWPVETWRSRPSPRLFGLTALVGLLAVLALGTGLVPASPSLRGIAAAGFGALLVAGLVLGAQTPVARGLSGRVPVFLGRISYGTYLWHWPVILVLHEVLVVSPAVVAVLAMALSTGLAAVSYEVLETPIRRGTFLDGFRWQTAITGVATSALLAVTVVPWALEKEQRPALATLQNGTSAGAGMGDGDRPEPMPEEIDWKQVEADTGEERSCTAEDISECIVVQGNGLHVLVVGDSHARMMSRMFKEIAEEHDFTLSLNARAGCLWQEGLINTQSSPERQERCTEARVGWYDEVLPELDPDLVVLVSLPRDDEKKWSELIERRDGHDQPLHEAIFETTQETLAKVDRVAPRTLIVERVITPETFEPDDCLASAGDTAQCAVPVPIDTTASDGYYIAESADVEDVFTVNVNEAFCPSAPTCQPIVDGQVVWRDKHHLTASYAARQRAHVWQLIEQSGVLDGLS